MTTRDDIRILPDGPEPANSEEQHSALDRASDHDGITPDVPRVLFRPSPAAGRQRVPSPAERDRPRDISGRAQEPGGEFIARLEDALARAGDAEEPCALLLIRPDLRRPTGQPLPARLRPAVLQAVAHALFPLLQLSDTLEWANQEEFGVILAGTGVIGAIGVAHKMQRVLAGKRVLAGRDVVATARIGIALFPDQGTNASALIQQARVELEGR